MVKPAINVTHNSRKQFDQETTLIPLTNPTTFDVHPHYALKNGDDLWNKPPSNLKKSEMKNLIEFDNSPPIILDVSQPQVLSIINPQNDSTIGPSLFCVRDPSSTYLDDYGTGQDYFDAAEFILSMIQLPPPTQELCSINYAHLPPPIRSHEPIKPPATQLLTPLTIDVSSTQSTTYNSTQQLYSTLNYRLHLQLYYISIPSRMKMIIQNLWVAHIQARKMQVIHPRVST